MKLHEADLEQSYFQAVRKNTDNAVNYILICLAVAFLFLLYLVGLQRVQTVSNQATGQASGDREYQHPFNLPEPEISDSVDTTSQ